MTRCPELAILQAKWRLHEGGFVSCVAYRARAPAQFTEAQYANRRAARRRGAFLQVVARQSGDCRRGLPFGRFLARMMARYVDPQKAGPIVELGPGTGAITEALLERGIAPGRLFLVEFDPGFCKLLKRRFPGIHVIKGDAYNLTETLGNRLRRPPAAIVSSLPLLLKPEIQRLALLADAFNA